MTVISAAMKSTQSQIDGAFMNAKENLIVKENQLKFS